LLQGRLGYCAPQGAATTGAAAIVCFYPTLQHIAFRARAPSLASALQRRLPINYYPPSVLASAGHRHPGGNFRYFRSAGCGIVNAETSIELDFRRPSVSITRISSPATTDNCPSGLTISGMDAGRRRGNFKAATLVLSRMSINFRRAQPLADFLCHSVVSPLRRSDNWRNFHFKYRQ